MASPLSTALLVKNPAGVFVRLDGELAPYCEQRTLNILSAKDNSVILCAFVSEVGSSCQIRVETKARSIPIATLETSGALLKLGSARVPQEPRWVWLHRVGDTPDQLGAPCAWVIPAGEGKYQVYYTGASSEVALVAFTRGFPPHIDRLEDREGQVLARSDLPGHYSGGRCPALWIKQGVDMALVACIALSVQKLASPHLRT